MRFAQAFCHDVKMQWRQGFYFIYAILSAIYVLVLQQFSAGTQEVAALLLTFSDPSVLGFFFIGGLVLLEKAQELLGPLFVTPYTPRQYIWSKTLSLTLLSVTAAFGIHLGVFGISQGSGMFDFMTGVVLTSVFFTLLGLGFAVYCQTLNGFFFLGTLGTLIFLMPILNVVGVVSFPYFAWLPSHAGLKLLGAPFELLGWDERLFSWLNLASWIWLAELGVRQAFRRRLPSVGGGRMT
ncbi:ABC transporter permease [Brevibacillus ruminantium]|uniref:ABC transporter permease n=1 Tax=Brevibacillus ruminantium TaxID=2950604 RepID=A0ABY4WM69_9BACL|nr:ABC transporter permease [Brevibacillus ruminantium]USG66940.1 ABC transporter permease [Brevibacillus ruminantium]